MNILVTGAKGFVGKNLCAALKNIRDNKDKTRNIKIEEIFEYDIDTERNLLDGFCERADFVFNLAGVRTTRSLWRAISDLPRICLISLKSIIINVR